MARRRILVVEDDPGIRQGIVDALEFTGFAMLEAANGTEGLDSDTGRVAQRIGQAARPLVTHLIAGHH